MILQQEAWINYINLFIIKITSLIFIERRHKTIVAETINSTDIRTMQS